MSENDKIKVGSRKSELALIQTNHVISLLKQIYPEKQFEIITMNTLGDKILDIPLPKIGEKSLFTKELEASLESRAVDFIVHSLKDLPTSLPKGMAIGVVLTREDPRDALVLKKDWDQFNLKTLPVQSVIGTSSLRRTAQLARKYPHLKVEDIRGNLNTRLRKLDDLGQYQAIILAAAGLIRIGWKDRISQMLEEDELMYAVGQGALAVECRADDERIIELLQPLYDIPTALRVTAERSFLKTLGGGCSAPVAVYSNLKAVTQNELTLTLNGSVWSLDGKEEITNGEQVNIFVKKSLRCATCPYNGDRRDIADIENCSNCPDSGEPRCKRRRAEEVVPANILKNDPHEKCPVKLPVGEDFMGKCPYLENLNTQDLFLLNNEVKYDKCPFLDKINFTSSKFDDQSETQTDDTLMCGLVVHKDIGYDDMEKARNLGENLAKKLISKGALEIMSKAQAIVHGKVVN